MNDISSIEIIAEIKNRDGVIGNRVKTVRILNGITQKEIGNMLGVSFQQIQKYENGVNRISSGKLSMISDILNVPISYFYDGLSNEDRKIGYDNNIKGIDSIHIRKQILSLIRYFKMIENSSVRNSIVSLVRSLSEGVSILQAAWAKNSPHDQSLKIKEADTKEATLGQDGV